MPTHDQNHQQTKWLHILPTRPSNFPKPVKQFTTNHLRRLSFFLNLVSLGLWHGKVASCNSVFFFFFGGLPVCQTAAVPRWCLGHPSVKWRRRQLAEVPKIEEKQCLGWRAGRLSNRGVSTTKRSCGPMVLKVRKRWTVGYLYFITHNLSSCPKSSSHNLRYLQDLRNDIALLFILLHHITMTGFTLDIIMPALSIYTLFDILIVCHPSGA